MALVFFGGPEKHMTSTQGKLEWCTVLGLPVFGEIGEQQVRAAARRALLESHPDKGGCRPLDPHHIIRAKEAALRDLAAGADPCGVEPMDLD